MRRLSILVFLAARAWAGYQYCAPVTFAVHPGSTLANNTVFICANGAAGTNCDSAAHVSLDQPKLKTVANGGAATSAFGYDIGVFPNADCTGTISYQLVPGTYVASTGAGEWHALIASQSSSTDTVLYMGVGNAAITTDQSTLNTFPTSVSSRVWHMQSVDGLSPFTSADSTPNSPTGDLNNLPAVSVVAGQLFQGFTQSTTGFAGASGTTGIPVGQVPVSLSCWVRTSTLNASHATVIGYADTLNTQEWGLWIKSNGSTCTADWNWFTNFGACSSSTTIADGSLHYIVGTFDGTSASKIYIDGVLLGTDTLHPPTIPTDFSGLKIFQNQIFGGHELVGDADDCRVWNIEASADRVAAQYANQFSPATYYTFGAFVATGGGVRRVISQ